MHQRMTRIRQRPAVRLPRIGVDRLGGEAQHVPLMDQPFDCLLQRPRRVTPVVLPVHERHRVADPLGPIGAKRQPAPCGNPAMPPLPVPQKVDRQQPVVILGDLRAGIDHDSRGDEVPHINRVNRIPRQVPPGNPVSRSIKVRPRMLATREIIPIPTWPRLVITGNGLKSKRGHLAECRGQGKSRKIRRQHVRQIHHPNRTPSTSRRQLNQNLRQAKPSRKSETNPQRPPLSPAPIARSPDRPLAPPSLLSPLSSLLSPRSSLLAPRSSLLVPKRIKHPQQTPQRVSEYREPPRDQKAPAPIESNPAIATPANYPSPTFPTPPPSPPGTGSLSRPPPTNSPKANHRPSALNQAGNSACPSPHRDLVRFKEIEHPPSPRGNLRWVARFRS